MKWHVLICLFLWLTTTNAHAFAVVDSIGIEINNKDTIILHETGKGESFYSISKKYKISVQTLMTFNSATASSLRIGQLLRIPKNNVAVAKATTMATNPLPPPPQNSTQTDTLFTKRYSVKKGDYLYSIAKTYKINIQQLKDVNNLTTNNLKIGQVLLIPNRATLALAADTSNMQGIDTSTKSRTSARFIRNVREIDETGVAGWIRTDIATSSGISYALHRTAPIGTIVKVTNTMNNKNVLVKVIGLLPDTGDNDNMLIKISAGAAKTLGVINEKFQAKLHYAVPKE